MDMCVFRLENRESGKFEGIVGIFMTKIPDVWRRLTSDEEAHQVLHCVMKNEAAHLRVELQALDEATPIQSGPSLVSQLFNDHEVSADHRVTLVCRHTFPMIVGTQASFKSH